MKQANSLVSTLVLALVVGACAGSSSIVQDSAVDSLASRPAQTETPSRATTSTAVPPPSSTTSSSTLPTQFPDGPVSYVTYTDSDFEFSILYPDGWRVFRDPDGTGDIPVLFAGPSYPDGPSVYLLVEDVEPGVSLDEYVGRRMADIRASSPGQEFLEEGETGLGDEPAWFLAYAATLQPIGTSIYFSEVIGLRGDRAYIVTYTSPVATWSDWAGVLGPMVVSFDPDSRA